MKVETKFENKEDEETQLKARRKNLVAEQQKAIEELQAAQQKVVIVQALIDRLNAAIAKIDELLEGEKRRF
jgi:hypothetical protein